MSAPVEPPPAPAPPARRTLPWYAFLYRLLGAQGTFWLWIVSIVAVWWTASPTLERFANRQRTSGRSPASLGSLDALTDRTRWVETKGVLVRLDRALLYDERAPTLAPMPVLFDEGDPAAAWWRETRALAAALRELAVPEVGGLAMGLDPARGVQIRRELQARRNALRGDPGRFVPAPSTSLLIQPRDRCPTLDPPPRRQQTGADNPIDGLIASVNSWAALVVERVEPDARLSGVLVTAPRTVVDRLKGELGAEVAPLLLQADVEPRDTETYVFAGAAITLLLLAGGFHGVLRASQPA